MYNDGGTITVDSATVSGNTATNNGGGVFNEFGGTIDLINGAAVSTNNASRGGGLYNFGSGSTITVDGSTVSGNTAIFGGGVYNQSGGTVDLINGAAVSTNNASNGGGLFNLGSGSTITVDGSTISGNSATFGGGVYNTSGGTVDLINGAEVSTNTAVSGGGGLYNLGSGSTITVDGSTVSGNTATFEGGGVYNISGGTVDLINGAAVSTNNAANGGGLFNLGSGSTITVDGSTVSDNTATFNGGGVFNESGGTIDLINLASLSANTAFNGGGLFNSGAGGTITVDGSTITNNTATSSGGGILNSSSGTIDLLNSAAVSANTAQAGGGLYNTGANSTITVDGSTVSSNTATSNGGGIYNQSGGTVDLINGAAVSTNTASRGGGLYNIDSGSTITVDGSTVSGNTAAFRGGGVYNTGTGSTITVDNSTVSGNTASNSGGGIFNESGNALTFADSILIDNTATNGGGIRNDGSLTLSGTATVLDINSPDTISGIGNITVSPTGTVTFATGTLSTYTGTTTLTSGTTIVNGTIDNNGTLDSSGGLVTVQSGTTLSGTGTFDAPVDVNTGGTIAIGATNGTLTLGDTNLQTGSTIDVKINNLSDPSPLAGTDFDQFIVNGTVTIDTTSTLNLIDNLPGSNNGVFGDVLVLINNDGADAVIGTFAGLPNAGDFMFDGNTWRIFYAGGDGNDVVMALVDNTDIIYVDDDYTPANGFANGTVILDADPGTPGDQIAVVGINAFDTIVEGINAVDDPGTVYINTGTYIGNVDTTSKELIIKPASGAAQIAILGNLTLDSDDTLQIEIGGTNATSEYDNFLVLGNVTIGDATLETTLINSFVPLLNNVFTIVNNDQADAINGIFDGLPQNSPLMLGASEFSIQYTGNDGNDAIIISAQEPEVEHGENANISLANIIPNPSGPITFTVELVDPLFTLQQQLGLTAPEIASGFNFRGQKERYLKSSNGSNPAGQGFYVLMPDNKLYEYKDGFAGPLTLAATLGGTPVADFSTGVYSSGSTTAVYDNPAILTSTTGAPLVSGVNPLFDLKVKLGLTNPLTSFNFAGANEKYLTSTNNSNAGPGRFNYFVLLPNNTLVKFNGVSAVTSPVVADFTALGLGNVYADPSLLTNATLPLLPGLTAVATNNPGPGPGGSLSITPAAAFDRTVSVKVTANDGTTTVQQTFTFSVENTVPVLSPIMAQSQFTLVDSIDVPLTVTDPNPDAALRTFDVKVEGYNPLFDLKNELGITNPQYEFNFFGQNERWFQSTNGSNVAGSGRYVLTMDNELYAFDGVSFATTIGNSANMVADFSAGPFNNPTVYRNPAQLFDAKPPVSPTYYVNRGPLYDAKIQFGLTSAPYAFNFFGENERWFQSTNGSNPEGMGRFVLMPDDQLYAFDGFSFATTIDRTPVANLSGLGAYADPTLLTNSRPTTVVDENFEAKDRFGITKAEVPGTFNFRGENERYFISTNNSNPAGANFYVLMPNGNLLAWNGIDLATSPVVATLNTSVHTNPELLYAASGQAPAIVATVDSGTGVLTLNPQTGFVGQVRVKVTVSDGAAEDSESFIYTVTSTI
ncbi:MAG: hypothetical protein R3B84_09750 [Zavarzinella sp.]